jgi:hypothetical protein
MSRVATPQTPSSTTSSSSVKVPHDKIAQRAYEKWCKRGCNHGNDRQDWLEAEAELRSEMSRATGSSQPRR